MDADATAMIGQGGAAAAMNSEDCPNCSTEIMPGDQFCSKCGYQRGTWAATKPAQAAGMPAAATAAAAQASGPALWRVSIDDGQSWELSAGTHVIGRGGVELQLSDGFASRRHAQLEVSADSVVLTDLGSSNGTFIGSERLAAEQPRDLTDGATFKVANTELRLSKLAVEQAPGGDATELPGDDTDGIAESTQEYAADGTENMAQHHHELEADNADTPVDPDSQPEPGKEGHTPAYVSASHWQLEREGAEPIQLELGELTLGRKPDKCDVVIDGDSYVSGVHARLIVAEDKLEVTDLGSTNGTFVNGARLEAQQPWPVESGDKLKIGQTELTALNNRPAVTEGQRETLEEEGEL